jgi:nucleotide-binding universal stress UspA family protein
MGAHHTILIAVDNSDESVSAGRAAVALFGESAEYTFAHVAEPVAMTPAIAPLGGAVVYPAGGTAMTDDPDETRASAQFVARHAADEAGCSTATSVGLIGDPVDALLDEADRCNADVIVVGAHEHGWFTDLITRSVTRQLERKSNVPVLVMPHHPD